MELHNKFSPIEGQLTTVGQLTPTRQQNQPSISSWLLSLPFALLVLFIILAIVIGFLQSCLCICKPNEVVVLSGRKRKNKSGQELGYRVISGGRGIRIPILETIKRIDVTTMPVPVKVTNAYSKGGTPLDIQAIANVKISSNPKVVGNAIERFLDQDRSEIVRVARETLEDTVGECATNNLT